MKILFATIICLISTAVFSQKGSLKLGLGASYEAVEYDFIADENNTVTEFGNEGRLSVGLNIQYQLTNKLTLTSGVSLSTQEFSKSYNWAFIDPNDSTIPIKTTFEAKYLRVPLLLGVKIESEKFDFIPSAGFNFDLLLNTNESSIYADDSERDSKLYTSDLSNPHIFFTLDLLLSYNASDKISIGLAPYLNQALDIIDNKNIKDPETNLGGRIAIFYTLK